MSVSRLRALALASVAFVVLVPAVGAATVVSGQDYVLAAGEVVEDNLYAFGQNVRIDGTVKGDVVGAAVKVEVGPEGRIEGDLLAAGQGVVINGVVDGDVRAAGFTVQVDGTGRVEGDLVGAGYSVGVATAAKVGGDVLAVGAQGLLDGQVGGGARFAGSGLEINGVVAGNVDAEVDAPSAGGPGMPFFPMIQVQPPRIIGPGLDVADSARIGGHLTYASPVEVEVPEVAVKSVPEFNPVARDEGKADDGAAAPERPRWLAWLIDLVKNYVALVIFALLFALVAPRALDAGAELIATSPAPAFGWGVGTAAVALLLVVLVPIVTIALLVLVGALQIGPLGKPILATALVTGALVTAGIYLLSWFGRVVLSHWLGQRLTAPLTLEGGTARWVGLLVGLLVYAVLVALPWVGFLIKLVLIFFGLGAVVALLWQWWRARAAVAEVVA